MITNDSVRRVREICKLRREGKATEADLLELEIISKEAIQEVAEAKARNQALIHELFSDENYKPKA